MDLQKNSLRYIAVFTSVQYTKNLTLFPSPQVRRGMSGLVRVRSNLYCTQPKTAIVKTLNYQKTRFAIGVGWVVACTPRRGGTKPDITKTQVGLLYSSRKLRLRVACFWSSTLSLYPTYYSGFHLDRIQMNLTPFPSPQVRRGVSAGRGEVPSCIGLN